MSIPLGNELHFIATEEPHGGSWREASVLVNGILRDIRIGAVKSEAQMADLERILGEQEDRKLLEQVLKADDETKQRVAITISWNHSREIPPRFKKFIEAQNFTRIPYEVIDKDSHFTTSTGQ